MAFVAGTSVTFHQWGAAEWAAELSPTTVVNPATTPPPQARVVLGRGRAGQHDRHLRGAGARTGIGIGSWVWTDHEMV